MTLHSLADKIRMDPKTIKAWIDEYPTRTRGIRKRGYEMTFRQAMIVAYGVLMGFNFRGAEDMYNRSKQMLAAVKSIERDHGQEKLLRNHPGVGQVRQKTPARGKDVVRRNHRTGE